MEQTDRTTAYVADRPRLVGLATRVLGDAAEAEDVVQRLVQLLAPDALVVGDEAAVLAGTPARIEGRDEVAAFFNGAAKAAVPVFVEDRPGSAWFHRGEARVAFDFTVTDGTVSRIAFRADPDLLARVTRRRSSPSSMQTD